MPKLLSDSKEHVVIRRSPIAKKKDIIAYMKEQQFGYHSLYACGSQE